MADFVIKRNDRLPPIQTVLTTASGPVDLSTATVQFNMIPIGGGALKVTAACTVVSPTGGVVRYDWAAADTNTAGMYLAEFQVTFTGGKKQTFPNDGNHVIQVTADLDAS